MSLESSDMSNASESSNTSESSDISKEIDLFSSGDRDYYLDMDEMDIKYNYISRSYGNTYGT